MPRLCSGSGSRRRERSPIEDPGLENVIARQLAVLEMVIL